MKKIYLFALSLAIMFLFFQCEKEPSSSIKSELYNSMSEVLQDLYDQLPTHDFGNITVIGDGILRFTSFSEYERVYGLLNQDCETWDSLFYDMYSYLDEDSLTEEELSLGYNEFQPLVEFEYQYEVLGQMLRDQQELAINNWLSSNMAYENPSDTIIIDEVEQALFNSNREICIGDSIYQLRANGYVVIPIDSVNKMTTYRGMSLSTLQELFHVVLKDHSPKSGFMYIPRTWKGVIEVSPNTAFSTWFVSGRCNTVINGRQRLKMVSKLVNYKYNSRRGKYVKARQYCDLTTAVSFYWERYSNLPLPIDCGYRDLVTNNLVPRNRISRRDCVRDSISVDNYYYYCFGVKKNPKLKVSINNVEDNQDITE